MGLKQGYIPKLLGNFSGHPTEKHWHEEIRASILLPRGHCRVLATDIRQRAEGKNGEWVDSTNRKMLDGSAPVTPGIPCPLGALEPSQDRRWERPRALREEALPCHLSGGSPFLGFLV